jgi:hypothetical protein
MIAQRIKLKITLSQLLRKEEEASGSDLNQVFEECRSIKEEDIGCATNELDLCVVAAKQM